MKKVLFSIGLGLSVLLNPFYKANADTPNWTGQADWDYTVVCLNTPSNARLNPNFANNVRATLVFPTCGNPLINNSNSFIYENEFFLVEFYFDEVGEWRRYWIHESQFRNVYF